VMCKDNPVLMYKPHVYYNGVVTTGETWVASFTARYRVDSFEHKSLAREAVWNCVRARFN